MAIDIYFNYITKDDEDSSTRNIATWEAMLDMVYNNKTLYQVVNRHQWCKSVDNRKEVITIKITYLMMDSLNI